MSAEHIDRPGAFRQAIPLSIPNVFYALFDSPVLRPRIKFGTLSGDGKTVIVRNGNIQVDRADANPGEKVVVYEV
ncbi:hypothetical protein A3E46_00910 [Candidatus Woesebacteria bacterium RIFCSPHIGHO2_12_FULL_46_16]|uniref:Uncharacterized protein n=1 Tax=Candidatus Woesebacteria bacterium RIFCSPHIGHO2_12_FULL_46_16 TaxID=1802513 RepID=A0A1F8AYL9_9BACT|nr:MAG: hypothetical protein A3E46_00910 [Candidatus Woesebacteria bacterium RIFCSPHIGHO2_12_FULL_46_16]